MNDEAQAWFRKARDELETARITRNLVSSDCIVDRAYFAMFSAATAMGVAEGKRYPKCSMWLSAFGEAFVDTGRVRSQFLNDLREAYRLRRCAVYGLREEDRMTGEMADSLVSKAQSFVTMAEDFLRGSGGKSENPKETKPAPCGRPRGAGGLSLIHI